jgi:hypothetical protein
MIIELFRLWRPLVTCVASFFAIGSDGGIACAQISDRGASSKEADRAARLDEMRQIARSFAAVTVDGNRREPATMAKDPLYRWNDPTREFSDGTLWIWRSSGRPIGVVAIELYPYDKAFGIVWNLEFTSLATGRIEVDGGEHFDRAYADLYPPRLDGRLRWEPKKGGVEFRRIEGAPVPATTEADRMRQVKDIVQRFSAREVFKSQNYALRLISRPIDRFADKTSGVIDGQTFIFGNGTNPEVLLILEAVSSPGSPPTWSYAAAPLARAELGLLLDRNEVWTFRGRRVPIPEDIYFLARRPRKRLTSQSASGITPAKRQD